MTATMTQAEKRADAPSAMQTFLSRHAGLMPTFAAMAILLLLFAGAEALLRGDFITPRNISALLLDNAYLLILAVGMTFVIGTSLMGGKFSIAGTVIGVLIIQTLESTILFLGVPSAQSPVFFAIVVVIVVVAQSPQVRNWIKSVSGALPSRSADAKDREKAEVAS